MNRQQMIIDFAILGIAIAVFIYLKQTIPFGPAEGFTAITKLFGG